MAGGGWGRAPVTLKGWGQASVGERRPGCLPGLQCHGSVAAPAAACPRCLREGAEGPLLLASWGTRQGELGTKATELKSIPLPSIPSPALPQPVLCLLMGGRAMPGPHPQPHPPQRFHREPPLPPPGVFLAPTWPVQRPFKALWLPAQDPMGLQSEDCEWMEEGGVQRVRSSCLQPQPDVGAPRGWERPY